MIEPFEAARNALRAARGFVAHAAADSLTTRADLIVWALKPQSFANAASSVSSYAGGALQLSVMAGIRTPSIVSATGSARVVRCMPNMPALVGHGIAGLYAAPAVTAIDRL